MLEVCDIHTYYGESHVLHGISLRVANGSVVALLGRNGMGKTTTVRSIIGFTPPRSGIVQFKGEEVQGWHPNRICQKGLALVPQGRRIFPSLSVEENLTIGARGDGWTLERAYSSFPVLKKRARHKGNMLSGGEQQMLCIARALLTNPDLLLMDEPSEGLAPIVVGQVAEIVAGVKKGGISILLVEQNVALALEVSDDVYVLSKGEIAVHSRAEVFFADEEAKIRYLGVSG